MNHVSIFTTIVMVMLIFALPRRAAALPLLMATSWVTRGMAVELGPVSLTLLHITVAAGVLRTVSRGEMLAHGMNGIDRMVILGALTLLATGVVRDADGFVYRAGMVWSEIGSYFLFRIFITDGDDVLRVFRMTCIVLVPIAMLMLLEKHFGENMFAIVGGHTEATLRFNEQVRARGPFAHPILAGTVGATCLGMAIALWKGHRMSALAGLFASAGIVWSATSSGPVMMAAFIVLALLAYPMRAGLRLARWIAVTAVIVLNAVMHDPVYFLMAKIDITGGSQGWYRAQLIRSSIEHLNEWWLAGTDYTRHWMPSGTHANNTQADITNQYLQMGVWGGLPLMLLFILMLVIAFRTIGRSEVAPRYRFLAWAIGCILFGHVVNLLSITLFDQSIVYFYLILATVGAIAGTKQAAPATAAAGRGRAAIAATPARTQNVWTPQ